MRKVFSAVSVLVVLLAVSGADAAEHAIEVTIADEIALDADVLAGVLDSAADDAELPRAVRGIAATTVAELRIALDERISETDLLELDDGSEVPLVDGDKVIVEMMKSVSIGACRVTKRPGAFTCGVLLFSLKCGPSKKCQPGADFIDFSVLLPAPSEEDQCRMSMSLPTGRRVKKGHPGLNCTPSETQE